MTSEQKLLESTEYERRAIELNKEFEAVLYGGESERKGYYDLFWDGYQNNGNRYHYSNAFMQQGWTDVTYKPKYPFTTPIRYANSMFQNAYISDTLHPVDFTNLQAAAGGVFQQCVYLKTIRTITVKETTTFQNWFNNCSEIETITFAGTIGQNLDIHWSTKLTAESYNSIMTHCSKTASFTLTLAPEATVRSVYDATYGTGAWDAIIAEYSNVTIAYS